MTHYIVTIGFLRAEFIEFTDKHSLALKSVNLNEIKVTLNLYFVKIKMFGAFQITFCIILYIKIIVVFRPRLSLGWEFQIWDSLK